ncbi:RNase P/RNase MRP complex subunit [Saccharomycopsis crataegensis]|uniref:RNase P/RNase MRP complex subunit n=1 Tax=Saccharomycopsis crataegensis TaxID=43959 RepID=A0AAV5QPU8_9ASCO|nr:RNase P/RNase MRP complex subunit [Saccharomycopsis crataegensis]
MERQLLARSRFFNSSVDLDELLQARYSRSGSQKSYMVLKPTGSGFEESEKSLLHGLESQENVDNDGGKSKRLKNIPSNKVGRLDPNVDWEKRVNKYNKTKAKKLKKIAKTEKKQSKHIDSKRIPKDVIRRFDSINDKKNKKTTRLVFRSYVKDTISNQRKAISKLNNCHEQLTSNQEIKEAMDKWIKVFGIPQYDDYTSLNELWTGYIQDLLFPNPKAPLAAQQILPKLSSAELIGAIVRVTDSKEVGLKNLLGIVLYEYKNFFVILVPNGLKVGDNVSIGQQNELLTKYQTGEFISEDGKTSLFTNKELVGGIKMIEKKTCIFKIIVPFKDKVVSKNESVSSNEGDSELKMSKDYNLLEFLIIGPRFNFKSVDRSNKKLKGRNADDLVDLLGAKN